MVLIKVDTFTIFDTMESMKGHRRPRRTIQNELTECNTTLFHTNSAWFFVIASGGTNLNQRPRVSNHKSNVLLNKL